MLRENKIQYVPIEFQLRHPFTYPAHNKYEFERWFRDNCSNSDVTGERTYLPILWTSYHVTHNYGQSNSHRNKLQLFVSSLPRNKKYFTVCQYDDGPMVDFGTLDIIVCGMSGGRIDYPIPLIAEPHKKIQLYGGRLKRPYFCSFVGADTHPVRKHLAAQFAGKQFCSVSFKKMHASEFCALMSQTIFALCPRGYGKTSFRIQEALQFGAIPVYISDEHIIPYNEHFEYGVLCNANENVYEYLKQLSSETVQQLQHAGVSAYEKFTYGGCRTRILNYVNSH